MMKRKFEGYPADPVTVNGVNYYQGDFVIFAEGNIRIRGVVGGKDPETDNYFVRHLTVVSNANIYIDGNLLRDNIKSDDNDNRAKAVAGRSSIALLSKNYIAVNTTQFITPQQQLFESETKNREQPFPRVVRINAGPGIEIFVSVHLRPGSTGPGERFPDAALSNCQRADYASHFPAARGGRYSGPRDQYQYIRQ